jgi:hypothetical protein
MKIRWNWAEIRATAVVCLAVVALVTTFYFL